MYGHLDTVRELLARGAYANAESNSGWTPVYTPLMWSSVFGHVEVVRALLAAGADKRHVANHGDTAASVAGRYKLGSRSAILALLAAAL